MSNGMRHGEWMAIGGADDGGIQRYALLGYDGPNVHAWVQSVSPDGQVGMAHATENLNSVENDLNRQITLASGDIESIVGIDPGYAAEAGLFGIGKLLKKIARKTGITKVLKKASKLADYALSNPWVKGALAATGPMGASIIAAHAGYKMLRRLKRGSKKALRFVKNIARKAKGGNRRAIKMQRMLRMGNRAFGTGAMRRYAVGRRPRYGTRRFGRRYQPLCSRGRVSGDLEAISGADSLELDSLIGGWEGDGALMGNDVIVGEEMIMGEDAIFGADSDAAEEADMLALNEYAASAGAWEGIALLGADLGMEDEGLTGAWEGVQWAASRLGLHPMASHANEMTARDALLDGRAGQAARFGF